MYLIPTDDAYVEEVAKAIARNRMQIESSSMFESVTGRSIKMDDNLEETLDRVFELIWAGDSAEDKRQRQTYKSDALAAIRVINLKLITSAE